MCDGYASDPGDGSCCASDYDSEIASLQIEYHSDLPSTVELSAAVI